MLDSIHLARWLEQFENDNYEFFLFPSKKYRKIHPRIKSLISSKGMSKYVYVHLPYHRLSSGYIDYLRFEILGLRKIVLSRQKSLLKVLQKKNYDFIHAIEIQGAGYLLGSIEHKSWKHTKSILTNWGSDISYFGKIYKHELLIRSVLEKVNFYSAECQRDYELALRFGFKGIFLPCLPNAGGFDIEDSRKNYIDPDMRKQIIIKGYGGVFGRFNIVCPLIQEIHRIFPDFDFFIYSVTEDSLELIEKLPEEVRKKVRVSTLKKPLDQKEILQEFMRSRIYIGCSESDGISTSFLEALITGAYPIQANTSCANEWINKGAIGSIVGLNSNEILNHVLEALTNSKLVNSAASENYKISRILLSKSHTRLLASEFYK